MSNTRQLLENAICEMEVASVDGRYRVIDRILEVLMQPPSAAMIAALDPEIHPNWLGEKSYLLIIKAIAEGRA